MTLTSWTLAAVADPGGFLELAPVIDLGISAILAAGLAWVARWFIRQVGSGEWVPKRELDYTRQSYEAQLADKDRQIERADQRASEWRAAHETSERTREILNTQVRDFADAFRVHGVFFDAFREKIIDGGVGRLVLRAGEEPEDGGS